VNQQQQQKQYRETSLRERFKDPLRVKTEKVVTKTTTKHVSTCPKSYCFKLTSSSAWTDPGEALELEEHAP
jgi:hypothetical protein